MTGLRRRPVLVTGLPRSGTSWVGKMLQLSGEVVYVNEPMNPSDPPGRSPGVLRADVGGAFEYIRPDDDGVWSKAFRTRSGCAITRWPSCVATTLPTISPGWASTRRSSCSERIRGRRCLLDDPYATFSASWFAEALGVDVVLLVRDPASLAEAGASSAGRPGPRTSCVSRPWSMPYLQEPSRLSATRSARRMRRALTPSNRSPRCGARRTSRQSTLPRPPGAGSVADLRIVGRGARSLLRDAVPALRADLVGHDRRGSPAGDPAHPRWGPSGSGLLGSRRSGLARTAFQAKDSRAALAEQQRRLSPEEAERVRAFAGPAYPRIFGPCHDS